MTEKHVHLQLADSGLKKGSISLTGAVVMGTGVMIGVGIFALTGQIAELAGPWFPLSFLFGAIVTAFSAYIYIEPPAGAVAVGRPGGRLDSGG
jgi:amino acid transporter